MKLQLTFEGHTWMGRYFRQREHYDTFYRTETVLGVLLSGSDVLTTEQGLNWGGGHLPESFIALGLHSLSDRDIFCFFSIS